MVANAANLGIFKVRLDCHLLQTFVENLKDISVLWWTKNTQQHMAHMSHIFVRDNFSIVWINLANEETDNLVKSKGMDGKWRREFLSEEKTHKLQNPFST